MFLDDFEREKRFREAWEAIEIVRPVEYSLFTFGESMLSYFLVCSSAEKPRRASVRKGEVRINRPMIITPENAHGEFGNFFEDSEEEGLVDFLLTRTAHFKNMKFDNRRGDELWSDEGVEEAIARLNQKLDDQEEDHVAILKAPRKLAGLAVLRYVAERVSQSGPDNVQELRERGFLP